MNEEKKKSGKTLPIIIILLGLILIGVGLFIYFGTDTFKKENKNENKNENKQGEPVADKFEGIYAAENDKLYIYKKSNNVIHYMIGGNFEGTAKVTGDVAKEENTFKENEYFEFKLVDGGIELSYHTEEQNKEVAIDTGKYNKVSEYTKDNVYKEAVGDPALLTSKYSGVYKSGNITLYLYQTNEKNVMIETLSSSKDSFSETFEIIEDNKLGAKDFFDENTIAYEITFNDREFSLKVNDQVFGFDEEDKKFESTYSFERDITQSEIITEFYKGY